MTQRRDRLQNTPLEANSLNPKTHPRTTDEAITLTINDIANAVNYSSEFAMMDGRYVCWRMTARESGEPILPPLRPMRLHGLTIVLCLKGSLDVEINLERFHISENTLCVVGPEMLMSMINIDYSDIDIMALFIDDNFLRDVNIDLSAVNVRSLVESHSPIISLTDDEFQVFISHINLLALHAENDTDTVFKRNIARSLIAATAYNLLDLNFKRLSRLDEHGSHTTRQGLLVKDFFRLVHANYTVHRNMDFYARAMCLSAKYLSYIIRRETGRTGVDWINEFVIVEAKNLLRFSGKTIQQIAYTLNFANQGAFGKYFKHLTGQSPTDYQKS